MALSTQPYKGARDFYPEDKRRQKYMFSKLREVCERFGYEEYDAPILESMDLYLAKSGEEIVTEQTYAFEDRGGRQVVIRPEMTPTVSRMVAAKRQELAYPLRWYSIPNLWRYERPQRGRLREHWQLNVDLFGVADGMAELEIIQVADGIFKAYGARPDSYQIRLNSRKLMDYALASYLGLSPGEAEGIAKLIDRMNKMERSEFISKADILCSPSSREAGTVERLLSLLEVKAIGDLPEELQSQSSVAELKTLLEGLNAAGIDNVVFDITIMRGFDYYSDIVFEIFDTDPENNRAMMGGGRYDGLVGLFGVESIPTVGFGLGDVTLANFLDSHNLWPEIPSETEAYVVTVGDVLKAAQKPIAELREMGLNVAVDFSGKKIGGQFKAADKKGLRFVIVIGQTELDEEQFTLKDLQTGAEEKHSLQRIVSLIKDHRRRDSD